MELAEGNITLKISVLGYQFPSIRDKVHDSNWLLIGLELAIGELRFERIDPAVEAFELERLVKWLYLCADKDASLTDWPTAAASVTTRESFTEPNLGLEVVWGSIFKRPTGSCVLRFYLAAEFLPPFAELLDNDGAWNDGQISEVWINFSCSTEDLRRIGRELQADLLRFPTRVPRT